MGHYLHGEQQLIIYILIGKLLRVQATAYDLEWDTGFYLEIRRFQGIVSQVEEMK